MGLRPSASSAATIEYYLNGPSQSTRGHRLLDLVEARHTADRSLLAFFFKRRLSSRVAGEALGSAYEISDSTIMFPALSGHSKAKASTNFGEQPFEYPISGFPAVAYT